MLELYWERGPLPRDDGGPAPYRSLQRRAPRIVLLHRPLRRIGPAKWAETGGVSERTGLVYWSQDPLTRELRLKLARRRSGPSGRSQDPMSDHLSIYNAINSRQSLVSM